MISAHSALSSLKSLLVIRGDRRGISISKAAMHFISKRHKLVIIFVDFQYTREIVSIFRKETKGRIKMREEGRKGRGEKIKRIKMCCINIQIPHNKYNYYVLQTYIMNNF